MICQENAIHVADAGLHRVFEQGRADEVVLFPFIALVHPSGSVDDVARCHAIVEDVPSYCYSCTSLDVESAFREAVVVTIQL